MQIIVMSYIHRGEGSRFVILSNIGMSIFKWAMSCNIQLPACYIPGLEKDEETHFLRTSQMNQNGFELKLYFNAITIFLQMLISQPQFQTSNYISLTLRKQTKMNLILMHSQWPEIILSHIFNSIQHHGRTNQLISPLRSTTKNTTMVRKTITSISSTKSTPTIHTSC